MSNNLKVSLILFTILIVLCPLVLYSFNQKEFANFLLQIFSALGTCGAVFYAIFQSIPKKEKAEANFYFSPTDVKGTIENNSQDKELPKEINITIRNIGEVDIVLPDFLNIDIYAGRDVKGNINIPIKNKKIIIAGRERRLSYPVSFSDLLMSMVVNNEDLNIYTWTAKGTKIELKRTNLYLVF